MNECAELNWTERYLSKEQFSTRAFPKGQQIRRRSNPPMGSRNQSASGIASTSALGVMTVTDASTSAWQVYESVPDDKTRSLSTSAYYSNFAANVVCGWTSATNALLALDPTEISAESYVRRIINTAPSLSERVSKHTNDDAIKSLSHALLQALQQEPVLDGFSHAGEPILEKMFGDYPVDSSDWAINCLSKSESSSRAADVLKLLCRFKPLSAEWRRNVVEIALRSSSDEVRDIAIQAVESWAEPDLIALLRSHSEKVPWLADYARQVLRDLGE